MATRIGASDAAAFLTGWDEIEHDAHGTFRWARHDAQIHLEHASPVRRLRFAHRFVEHIALGAAIRVRGSGVVAHGLLDRVHDRWATSDVDLDDCVPAGAITIDVLPLETWEVERRPLAVAVRWIEAR